jgi:putative selenate reductase
VTLNLVKRFREHMGAAFPTSFSAGLDQHNVCNAVAMNFVPVTTCTDLLRPGGYARLPKYLENLGAKMREVGAPRISDFVLRYAGQGEEVIDSVVSAISRRYFNAAPVIYDIVTSRLKTWLATPGASLTEVCAGIQRDFSSNLVPQLPHALVSTLASELASLEHSLVETAGVLNTPVIVDHTTADPRYLGEKNKAVPRKIGSKLWLYDCISCDKCVPVCPNDANFVYESEAAEITYTNYELLPGGEARPIPGGVFKIAKAHQFANYADACNDCGNCDVFCPEDGGPQIEKPRFFGSLESYEKYAGRNGFFLAFEGATRTLHGTIAGKAYKLACDADHDRAQFHDNAAEVEIRISDYVMLAWSLKPGADAPHVLDLLPYLQLKFLLDAVSNPHHVNYANVAGLSGEYVAKKGAVQG